MKLTPLEHNCLLQFAEEMNLGITWMDDRYYATLAGLHQNGYVQDNKAAFSWEISKKGWRYINKLKKELGHC